MALPKRAGLGLKPQQVPEILATLPAVSLDQALLRSARWPGLPG